VSHGAGVRAARLTRASRIRWLNVVVTVAFVMVLILGAIWKEQEALALLRADKKAGAEFLESINSKYNEEGGNDEDVESDQRIPEPSERITEEDLKSQSHDYPDREVPLPDRIDLTFYTTARRIGPAQMVAIRSWLALGASVIVFADNITEVLEVPSTVTAETGLEDPDRLRILLTPYPRSLLGAPRLDLLMEAGELHATTRWVCMINADIVVPRRFGELIKGPFKRRDVIAIGERLDCRVNPALPRLPKSVRSFEDLEHWSMAPCWPHGSGGKDYFLYRKGFFERRGLTIPTFWVGKFVWDHWIVNATREYAVDLTPSLLVGHLSHEYDWNWRVLPRKSKEEIAQAKETALRDINWNTQVSGCDGKPIFDCLPSQSTYDVAFQLCPGDQIQSMPSRAGKRYDASVKNLRAVLKPKGQEGAARRKYQRHSLTGSTPSYWTDAIREWAVDHGCPNESPLLQS